MTSTSSKARTSNTVAAVVAALTLVLSLASVTVTMLLIHTAADLEQTAVMAQAASTSHH